MLSPDIKRLIAILKAINDYPDTARHDALDHLALELTEESSTNEQLDDVLSTWESVVIKDKPLTEEDWSKD